MEAPVHLSQKESDLLIAEFTALRAEILDHFTTTRAVLGLYLATIGAVAGLVASGSVPPNFVAIIPLVSPVFWSIHQDTVEVVGMIGTYLRDILSLRAQTLGSSFIFRWEETLGLMLTRPIFRILDWNATRLLGAGIEATAWPVYLIPSLLSLALTWQGSYSDLVLYTAKSGSTVSYPFWLWRASLVLNILLCLKALAANYSRSWRVELQTEGGIWRVAFKDGRNEREPMPASCTIAGVSMIVIGAVWLLQAAGLVRVTGSHSWAIVGALLFQAAGVWLLARRRAKRTTQSTFSPGM